ncbi:AAA family ATPase [Tritonibacter scottomollicae]|uniref:AAA family ATPase n=1 Tax=Tritonibacter scottomollicae TaxID=483013 RepID=UPI003AA858B8
MGIFDHNKPGQEWALSLDNNHIHLILSEKELAASELSDSDGGAVSLTLDMLDLDAALPPDLLKESRVVVIEVDGAVPSSIDRISSIRKKFPHLPVVAAVRNAALPLVRTLLKNGIADMIELPLSYSDLSEALQQILAGMKKDEKVETRPAKIISVIKSIGGVGASMIATQAASRYAEMHPGGQGGTCLFDLDLQFGSIASYLGVNQPLNLSDLLDAGSRIDGDLLQSVASTLPTGLKVISAPAEIMPMEAVNAEQIYRIIDIASREYDTIFIDLPGNWTNWSVSLVARSDIVLLVVELTIASLRQAKRQLALLESQGISGEHVQVVVNRVEKKLFRSINLQDAEKAINYPVQHSLHNDYPLVSAAQDQGVLIEEIRRKSKISKDIEILLASIDETLGRAD